MQDYRCPNIFFVTSANKRVYLAQENIAHLGTDTNIQVFVFNEFDMAVSTQPW